jgi:hypothetical protein
MWASNKIYKGISIKAWLASPWHPMGFHVLFRVSTCFHPKDDLLPPSLYTSTLSYNIPSDQSTKFHRMYTFNNLILSLTEREMFGWLEYALSV